MKKIELGNKTLVIKPGESYRLADDETTIQFGGSAVPDLVFGEHYSLNDIHKINSLPINSEVSFYNKGYYFNLKKTKCNTERKFDIDVYITVVTDCSFQTTSKQAETPTKQLSSRVSLETGSMTSYSTDTNWDIQVVSSYGIDTIRYTAEELWNKQTKTLSIGTLSVKSEVKNYTCKVLFKGNNGEQTEQCDDIVVGLQFNASNNKQVPIKLETYSKG